MIKQQKLGFSYRYDDDEFSENSAYPQPDFTPLASGARRSPQSNRSTLDGESSRQRRLAYGDYDEATPTRGTRTGAYANTDSTRGTRTGEYASPRPTRRVESSYNDDYEPRSTRSSYRDNYEPRSTRASYNYNDEPRSTRASYRDNYEPRSTRDSYNNDSADDDMPRATRRSATSQTGQSRSASRSTGTGTPRRRYVNAAELQDKPSSSRDFFHEDEPSSIRQATMRRKKNRSRTTLLISLVALMALIGVIAFALRGCSDTPPSVAAPVDNTSAPEGTNPVALQTHPVPLTTKDPSAIYVMLDPGHGGKDPGTDWNNTIYEKDINLSIVEKLEQILIDAGYTVFLTRDDDAYPTLSERVQAARDVQADIFISIHQNAFDEDTSVTGIESYCNVTSNALSASLTDAIHNHLITATNARDRGVMYDSDFHVVINSEIPACLIETGFLTSPDERALLTSDAYQQTIAQAIADGIMESFPLPNA